MTQSLSMKLFCLQFFSFFLLQISSKRVKAFEVPNEDPLKNMLGDSLKEGLTLEKIESDGTDFEEFLSNLFKLDILLIFVNKLPTKIFSNTGY